MGNLCPSLQGLGAGSAFGVAVAVLLKRASFHLKCGTRTQTIPANVAPGTYYLGFIVDNNGAVAEANESNNGQPMPRTITIF